MAGLIIIGIVTRAMLSAYIFPQIKLNVEKDQKSLVSGNCSLLSKGIMFGGHSLPGAGRFALYDSFMVISNILKSTIHYSSIESIKYSKNILASDSLHIKLYDSFSSVIISSNKAKDIALILEDKIAK